MSNYQNLKSRLDEGEVIILDGAIGTELQAMGVPMHPASWCGPGNYTHTATVRQMHMRYIKAGADIITTNTFNTIRPALEASGYPDLVREINVLSVEAAIDARERTPVDREVYIAGSISCRMPIRDHKNGALLGGTGFGYGASLSAEELRTYAGEQADVLAESGVDFFIMENMWADNESRLIAAEAAMATGLPVWIGFTASVAERWRDGEDEPPANDRYYTSGMGDADVHLDVATGRLRDDAERGGPRGGGAQSRRHHRFSQPDRRDDQSARGGSRGVVRRTLVAYPDAGRTDYLETVAGQQSSQ